MPQPLRQLIDGRPVVVAIDTHVANQAGVAALVEAARACECRVVGVAVIGAA